ncbi:MAG: hypothetical protein ABI873_00980 [Marmoricola sp.]
MASVPDVAAPLLQAGVLVAGILIAQVFALRHLPVDAIPDVLRGRVALSNRLRPWLFVAALTMAVTGLLLHLR